MWIISNGTYELRIKYNLESRLIYEDQQTSLILDLESLELE